MPIPAGFLVIQTSVTEELVGALKAHAAIHNVLLFDVFVQAIERFIAQWHSQKKKRQTVPYLMHPKGAKPFNIRLPEKLALALQPLAEEDNVSVRRLAYTALVLFAVSEKLIPQIGILQSGVTESKSDSKSASIADIVRAVKKKRQQA